MKHQLVSLALLLSAISQAQSGETRNFDNETYMDCAATLVMARQFTPDRNLSQQMERSRSWFTQSVVQKLEASGTSSEKATELVVQDMASRSKQLMIDVLVRGQGEQISLASFPKVETCLQLHQSNVK